MRPTFDAALIAHLKTRVIEHNEANPGAKTKLGDLRKIYERNFRRANPGVRALQKVEQHLDDLSKGGTFEEDEHPRGHGGEFARKGSAPAPAAPTPEQEHRARQASDPVYRAMTSDVIPDNRHEATGALIRDGVSVGGAAAATGALAASKRGGRLSRSAGNLAAYATGKRFGKFGRKAGEGAVNGLSAGVKSLLRVQTGSRLATAARKAGAFGVLSLAGGLALRSQWKDSFLDPAALGRTMDAYSYRTIQKVAASAELGTARAELTQALAKHAGPAGGSIDELRNWLQRGGGEMSEVGALAKGVPWGRAAVRLFSAVAGLGGGAAGSAAGYGAAKITETPVPEDADFETKHPRDEHGRFSVKSNTGRTHRFVQIGGLLGGAAAAIATHHALSSFNGRTNLANHGALREAYAEAIRKTQAFAGGRAAAAHRSGPKRVEALIEQEGKDPRFLAHRKELAAIDAMSPSDVGAIQAKVRRAYDEHLARQLAAYPEMEIPTRGGGWTRLAQAIAGAPKIGKVTAAEAEVMGALSRIHDHKDSAGVWKEMLDRMVAKKVINPGQAKAFAKTRQEAQAAVAAVPGNMKGHKAKLKAAEKAFVDAKKVTDDAKARLDLASTDLKLRGPTVDDAGKAGLESAQQVAEKEHAAAKKVSDAAEKVADKLRNNPVGVIHPIHKEPILPPTVGEIAREQSARRDKAFDAARKTATKIVQAENEQIRDRQVERLRRGFERRQLVMAADMARSDIPKRGRAAVAHLVALTEKAKITSKALADAELTHLPNAQEKKLLEAVSTKKTTKDGLTTFAIPKGVKMTPVEADALRMRGPEIHAAFDETKAAVDAAEAAHVAAVTNRDGALAAYNETMKELPPAPARHLIDPALRADIDRMRGEIAAMAGSYVKSPSGAKLKALYDKVLEDTARHGKAGLAQGKRLSIKALKDLFTRDDPGSPDGWRIDAGKVMTNVSFGTALAGAAKADIITHAQRWLGPEETRRAAEQRKTHIGAKQELTDGLEGRGYWTLHMRDPANPNDKVVLVGHTFENARGPTSPIATGASLSSLKAAIADREDRRKKALHANGGAQPGQGEDWSMPKMADEDRKHARAAVAALHGKQAIEKIDTFEGGPSIQLRKEGYQPGESEKELKATLSRGDTAVNTTLRDKHGLKDASPGGEAYHSALSALFSDEAKSQRRNRKFMFLTGYTEDGQKATGNASILKADAGYGGTAAEALSALSKEIDRVAAHNAPAKQSQAMNLQRAIGLVAKVKGIGAADTAPLYAKVTAAVGKPASSSAPSPAPSAAAAPPPSSAVAAPAQPGAPPIDIDKPTSAATRRRWSADAAHRAALDVGEDVSKALGIDNPTLAEHMPLAIAGMAESLHELEPSFTETEAVGEVTSVMHLLASKESYRNNVRHVLLNSEHRDPGSALWDYMKAAVALSVERKKKRNADLGKAADHPLDDVEQLVKLSMGSFIEALHPRAPSGSAGGGEFVASGASHAESGHAAGVSTGARIAGEAAEAGTMAARKLTGGNGGSAGTLPGEGGPRPKPAQPWYNPTRFGNEFGAALGFDTALSVAHTFLPEARLLEDGAGILARSAFKAKGLARGGAGLVAGSIGAEAASQGGEAAGSEAIRLATGRKAAEYQAPESHGMDSLLANSAGATVGGIVGTGIGRGVGAFAGRVIGGALGSVAGPVGAVVGGAALGYAGGKISEGIYDYFAGYDQPAVKRALARVGAGKGAVRA